MPTAGLNIIEEYDSEVDPIIVDGLNIRGLSCIGPPEKKEQSILTIKCVSKWVS